MNEKELLDGDPLKLPAQDDDADDDNFKMVKELMMIKMRTKMEAQVQAAANHPNYFLQLLRASSMTMSRVSQLSKN